MFLVVKQTHQGLSPRLENGAHIFLYLFRALRWYSSVGDDAPVNYKASVVISSIWRRAGCLYRVSKKPNSSYKSRWPKVKHKPLTRIGALILGWIPANQI